MRLSLGLSLGPRNAAPAFIPPGDIVITDDTIEASVAGSVGTLLLVGGTEPATFAILGEGGAFSISGNELVADGSQTADDYELTIRATDAGGRTFEEILTVHVVAEEDEGDGGVGAGEIVYDPEVFDVPPVSQNTEEGLKVAGKNGGTAALLFDIGPPQAGAIYTLHYDPDWSGLNKQGRYAAVGFGFKVGNDFHLVGARGNGAANTVMLASRIFGDFSKASQFTLTNDGPVAHGTKDGPNRQQLEIDQLGEVYIIRTSADGETWTDEISGQLPFPLGAATDAVEFGPAAYFANQDKGVFAIVFAFFALLQAENRFVDNVGSTTPLTGVNDPAGFYDAASQRSWLSFEGWNGHGREPVVTSYDHAQEQYGDALAAGPSPLVDDNHGTPAIIKDHEGYLHAFYGAHGSRILHSSTRWSVDGPSGAGSLWEIRGAIAAGDYTYPRLALVDDTLYVFARKGTFGGALQWLALLETTSLADGVAIWAAEKEIVDFGAGTRFYGTRLVKVGTELHFIGVKADSSDTARKNLYYFIYDTADGSLSNYNKSTTVASGSLPIDLTSADTNFRIVESGDNRTDIPGFERDSLGRMHIAYIDGEFPNFDVKHVMLSAGSWSSPVVVGQITGLDGVGFIDEIAITRMPNDAVAVYWPNDPGADWELGGDMARRIRSSAGVWGDLQTIMPAGERALARPVTIRDGHADARLMFSEILQSQEDASAGGLRVYVFGDSGLLQREIVDDAPEASGDLYLGADPLTLDGDPLTIDTD